MVIRCWKPPTTVQFPGEEHEIEEAINSEKPKRPLGNSAGRARSHPSSGGEGVSFTIEVVNASNSFDEFANSPTAVQFPGDAHDTDVNTAKLGSDWILAGNEAGSALPHIPLADIKVNASKSSVLFLKSPAAVQFPGDAHDTEARVPLGERL